MIYSITLMTRTRVARLPWLIRTRFLVPRTFFRYLKKTNNYKYFREIVLFYNENICCVYSLESPRWGDSNEYTQGDSN